MKTLKFSVNIILGLFIVIIGVNLVDLGIGLAELYKEPELDSMSGLVGGMFGVIAQEAVELIMIVLIGVFVSVVIGFVIINLKMK